LLDSLLQEINCLVIIYVFHMKTYDLFEITGALTV